MAVTAANAKKIYAKATAGAPSSGDEIAKVSSASFPQTRETVETTGYSDGIYKTRIATLFDMSGSMSGTEDLADSPQDLLRAHVTSGVVLYLTELTDGTNGYTYPVIITSYEPTGDVGGAEGFSCSFELNGAPVAVP